MNCVVVPKDHSAPLNQAARKTSSVQVNSILVVRVTNLARCRALQQDGFWIIGAAGESPVSLCEALNQGPCSSDGVRG